MSRPRKWIFFLAVFMAFAVILIIVLTLLGPAFAPTYDYISPR